MQEAFLLGQVPEQHSEGLQPLTHRTKSGMLLQRDPDVDAQISSALAFPAQELLNRARQADSKASGFLKEEALVYLTRAYRREGDNAMVNALSEALLRRCNEFIYSHLGGLGMTAMEEGHLEVVERLFRQILDVTSDRGDFLQVRFWSGLERLTISAFRKQLRQVNIQRKKQVPLSDVAGYDPEGGEEQDDEGKTGSVPSKAIIDSTPSSDRLALAKEALLTLEENVRKAYILHHEAGWQIDSKDPNEPTLSKYFKTTPRTIQNWLTKAEKALEEWRGQSHD